MDNLKKALALAIVLSVAGISVDLTTTWVYGYMPSEMQFHDWHNAEMNQGLVFFVSRYGYAMAATLGGGLVAVFEGSTLILAYLLFDQARKRTNYMKPKYFAIFLVMFGVFWFTTHTFAGFQWMVLRNACGLSSIPC